MSKVISIRWYTPMSVTGSLGLIVFENPEGERKARLGIVPRGMKEEESIQYVRKYGAKIPLEDIDMLSKELTGEKP